MDTQKRFYQSKLIELLREWGYLNLADRLGHLSVSGDDDREKRVADAWVILHFDVTEVKAESERGIQQFLCDMDALGPHWVGQRSDEAYRQYRDLSTSHGWRDLTRPQSFISILLDALCPPVEVT